MKKIFISIISLAIIVLAGLSIYKGALEQFAIDEEKKIEYDKNKWLYYYNQLGKEEKEMYIRLDEGINSLESNIHMGLFDSYVSRECIGKVITALYNDKPEYYFLPKDYNINSYKILGKEYICVEFKYSVKDEKERKTKDMKLKAAVQQIVQNNVFSDMSDVEKEMLIHDALAEQTKYYEYKNIEDIPYEKHTAYAALVDKEAVCDGISKAMLMLLREINIEGIVVYGQTEETPHAWNLVKLGEEYYHVDVTSDTVILENKKYVVHNYLNVNDNEIVKTHNINRDFDVPKCEGKEYNYYTYKNYKIDYLQSMKSELRRIINSQIGSPILEVKIDKLYSTNDVIETLYFLDFNNWHTDNKKTVSYQLLSGGEVYVFENKTNHRI